MSIIIDKLFLKPKVYPGFKEDEFKKYVNVKNLFIPVIVLGFFRYYDFSIFYSLLFAFIAFIYIANKNIAERQKKIDFLNSIMYSGNEQPFEVESYLGLAPELVDFYYNIQYYIDYNLTAYRKSLENTNNLLRYEYNLSQNLMKDPEQMYENGRLEYQQALNNLHSAIYKMISHRVNNDLFNDNLTTLKYLLTKHLDKMKKVIKCGYNLYNLNIWSLPYPSNLDCASDLNDKYYSPNFSFFR